VGFLADIITVFALFCRRAGYEYPFHDLISSAARGGHTRRRRPICWRAGVVVSERMKTPMIRPRKDIRRNLGLWCDLRSGVLQPARPLPRSAALFPIKSVIKNKADCHNLYGQGGRIAVMVFHSSCRKWVGGTSFRAEVGASVSSSGKAVFTDQTAREAD
jgi:hypothetical protein